MRISVTLHFFLFFCCFFSQRHYLTALASTEGHEHITDFLNKYYGKKLVWTFMIVDMLTVIIVILTLWWKLQTSGKLGGFPYVYQHPAIPFSCSFHIWQRGPLWWCKWLHSPWNYIPVNPLTYVYSIANIQNYSGANGSSRCCREACVGLVAGNDQWMTWFCSSVISPFYR